MKKIINLMKVLSVLGVLLFASCETTDLDLIKNPDAVDTSQVNTDFFLNNIQLSFKSFVNTAGSVGGTLTRVEYMSGRNYSTVYSPSSSSLQGLWGNAYSMFKDLKTMNRFSMLKGEVNHIAMGKIMQAYTMITMVDLFGDIPYTEALQGLDNLNPKVDSGASVYAAAETLLDEAIAGFDSNEADPQYDFYYNKDWSKWVKLANTLKMKIYMATRLVEPTAMTKFDAIVASGNFINDTADDFQFQYGTSSSSPNTRHPWYNTDYRGTGAGDYRSNSLMEYMGGDYPLQGTVRGLDPRMFYYFYRQVGETPGVDAPANEELLACSAQTAPIHYAGYVFCGVARGYWGRDHGNDEGIPPDNFKRAVAGIYPAGGQIDLLSPASTGTDKGEKGAGITPIWLASWTQFMLAEEAALVNNDLVTAKTFVFSGMVKSIEKVLATKPVGLFQNLVYPRFLAYMDSQWNAANDEGKKEMLAKQFFVATYGNSIDAYNFYRRTGYPHKLQPNVEPNPGTFPRSMWYPAAAANNNANISQKTDLSVQVFWDNNPSSGFPVAN